MNQTTNRKIFYVEIEGEVSDKRLKQIVHTFNTAQSIPVTITGWGEHPDGAVVDVSSTETASNEDAQVPLQAEVPQQTKVITILRAGWEASPSELDSLEARFLQKATNGVVAFNDSVEVYTIPLADEVKAKVAEDTKHKQFLESNYYKHATRELAILGYKTDGTEEGINKLIVEQILELVETCYHQKHSGSSAPYVLNIAKELSLFNAASPLTGGDSEWAEAVNFGNGLSQRNKRASNIFRDVDTGIASQYDYYVFEDPKGHRFTNKKSAKDIKFPYVVEHKIIKLDTEGFGDIPNETKSDAQD